MSITNKLIELDPTLVRHNEGHWDTPFHATLPGFSSFNDAGVECETGEFLYSMTRILKPHRVLETGTHVGVGASYIGMALKDNNTPDGLRAKLDTIEFLPEINKRAVERLRTLNLLEYVTPHLMDVMKFVPSESYGLILLDTEPQTRFAELIRFYPYLEEGGFVFIHDLHRHCHQINATRFNSDHPNAPYWPYGEMPQEIKSWVKTGELVPFHFSTPRGLTGFYKKSRNDYFQPTL